MAWEDEFKDSLTYLISKDLDENSKGHSWKRDDLVFPDGYVAVDVFAFEGGHYCNGPECESCGLSFCQHCTPLSRIKKCTNPVVDLVEKMSEVVELKRRK